MAAEDARWRQRWSAQLAPDIDKIRARHEYGMSRKRLVEIYGAMKVGLALDGEPAESVAP